MHHNLLWLEAAIPLPPWDDSGKRSLLAKYDRYCSSLVIAMETVLYMNRQGEPLKLAQTYVGSRRPELLVGSMAMILFSSNIILLRVLTFALAKVGSTVWASCSTIFIICHYMLLQKKEKEKESESSVITFEYQPFFFFKNDFFLFK